MQTFADVSTAAKTLKSTGVETGSIRKISLFLGLWLHQGKNFPH